MLPATSIKCCVVSEALKFRPPINSKVGTKASRNRTAKFLLVETCGIYEANGRAKRTAKAMIFSACLYFDVSKCFKAMAERPPA